MRTREVTVRARDGSGVVRPAKLLGCDQCGGEEFLIFLIGRDHYHLQCIECGETTCDGKCVRSEGGK